jgi:histidinol phosphatase-like enzyme
MRYLFDIDGTICKQANGDYTQAKPIMSRIEKVNQLYDEGHRILFWTARGMGRTNNNRDASYALFYTLTLEQLHEWGVKFHELHLGKLQTDYFIDDKGVSDVDFFGD